MPVKGVEMREDEELLHLAEGNVLSKHFELSDIILTVLTAGIWILWVLYKYMNNSSIEYIITDERIVIKEGGLSSSTIQITYESIVGDVKTEQNTLQSILNTGNILFFVQRATEESGKLKQSEGYKMQSKNTNFSREMVRLKNVVNYQSVADTICQMNLSDQ
jgi:hypothetical protein